MSSARHGIFTRARERSRVDHIKSRLKASTLPKKDTACSRSYSQQRLLGRWTCASRISTPAFAAEVLSTTIAATRCKTDTACSRSYSQRRLLGDGPARRASRRARVRGRGALNTTRSRPARAAAAGGGLDSPALPGALFLNRCVPSKGRLRAFALRLRCSALSSSPAQQRLRAQFKLSIRRVCTSLVSNVAIYAGRSQSL